MKKLISTILTVLFLLAGCNGATVNNNSNDASKEISFEESFESVESAESSDVSSESSEVVDSSEESFENISSEASSDVSFEEPSEEPSEDVSYEDSKEDDVSSAPVTPPVSGGESGNESKPEEDVSSAPVVPEPPAPPISGGDNGGGSGNTGNGGNGGSSTHTHNYTSLVYEPWCGEQGYTEYKCSCGHTYKADYTDALTHNYGEWKVVEEPTTTKEGKQRRLCKICNKFEYEIIPMIVVTITQADLDYMAECALEMLNEQRVAAGLHPLVTGPIAHQMASERAKELATDFSHNGCNSIYREYMYNPNDSWGSPEIGGENIAKSSMSTNDGITANKQNYLRVTGRGLMGGFQLSSGHWGDLMDDDYTACGVGVYVEKISDERYATYICVMTMDKLYGTDAA